MPTIAILAQQTGLTSDNRADVLFWCGVLLVVAVVLGLIAWWIRRRFNRDDEPDAGSVSGTGFTLAELRQMRDDGQLNAEEYDYARRKLIAKTRQSMEQGTPEDPLPNAQAEPRDPADPIGSDGQSVDDAAGIDPDDSGDFPTRGVPPEQADNLADPDKTPDGDAGDPPTPQP